MQCAILLLLSTVVVHCVMPSVDDTSLIAMVPLQLMETLAGFLAGTKI